MYRSALRIMRIVGSLAIAQCLIVGTAVSAGECPRRAAASPVRVYPNPASGVVHVVVVPSAPGSLIFEKPYLLVTVHNVTGRLVRKLRDGFLEAGDHGETTWDGRTESGRRVPSGFYYIRSVMSGHPSVAKVWYVR